MNVNIPNPWKFQFYFNELKHYHYVFRWRFKMWDSEWHGGYSSYTRDGQDIFNDDSINLFMFLFVFGIDTKKINSPWLLRHQLKLHQFIAVSSPDKAGLHQV